MNFAVSPYWLRLLHNFENKGYVKNGLTITFLIGALKVLDENARLWTIEEMIDSLDNYGCTILECGNIGEFVIGSLDSETSLMKSFYHCPSQKIFVTDSSLDNVANIGELKILLNERYKIRIKGKEFSKNNGIWTYFTENELIKIKELS